MILTVDSHAGVHAPFSVGASAASPFNQLPGSDYIMEMNQYSTPPYMIGGYFISNGGPPSVPVSVIPKTLCVFALVRDTAGLTTAYLNGTASTSQACPGALDKNQTGIDAGIRIGARHNHPGGYTTPAANTFQYPLTGDISEMRLIKKALTPSEIDLTTKALLHQMYDISIV